MLVFWVVTPCELLGRYQRFGGTYCLHHQGWSEVAGKWIVHFGKGEGLSWGEIGQPEQRNEEKIVRANREFPSREEGWVGRKKRPFKGPHDIPYVKLYISKKILSLGKCCLSACRIYLTVKPLSFAKCCRKNIFSTNNLLIFEQLKHFHEIMKWAKLSALQCRTLLVSIVTRCKNT
jgi:hypothetical protein